ncbi:MAG TPA: hypothetical protein VFV23_12080 [Verrucomicrobiae bacterium]|nr:hypothetical protein [Verrucomicrobiae bacterium]
MRRKFLFLPLLLMFAGCVTHHFSPPPGLFPANAFITQRATFTARGKQFPLDGFLAMSETGGKRFVITAMMGVVVADILVKPDGKIYIMRSSQMFPEKYIRNGVARDLECIFGGADDKNCPVQMLDRKHFIVHRFGYTLDVRILDVKPGPQPAKLFDETKAAKQ